MSASKILLYFCLSFIGGIFLSSIIKISQIYMLGFFILGIFFISIFWPFGKASTVSSAEPLRASLGRKKLVVFGFCLLFLVLGIFRHQTVESRSLKSELRSYNDREALVILIGIVNQEPDIREKSIKLTIGTEQLTINPENASLSLGDGAGNQQLTISDNVLITTWRYPKYEYGDKLKITGKLKTPPEFEDFNYKDYLKKEGIFSIMSFPEIELVSKNNGNFIYSKILQFKNKLRESIYSSLSPPQSSILGAMILGDKRKISEDWKQKLNIAGVRHITAVSGMHVAIVTTTLMAFFIALGFWRQQAFYFTIIFITLFIVMTGLQPSAIRAGIMGGFFLLAQHFGRLNNASRAIVFAGAVMLAQNPFLLRLDVGFQLSFLAMMGIIYLLPTFRSWLKIIPFEDVKSILAMTFSAYLFTLPILIYNFGFISIVSPLTNILIVPLLYLIMIFGFLFALLGTVLPFLGWILSFPAWILLTYVIKIVDWFSSVSWASLTLTNIHWTWLIVSYLILGYFAWRLQERLKSKFLN